MKQGLNDAQRQAVRHQHGPMLVLAGPGSGKTTVITQRIACLIQEAGVDPSHILVITFTKAAAGEMKERFLRQMPSEGKRVAFGTFHAVFFTILKHAYHLEASNIIREEEKQWILRDLIRSMHLDLEEEAEMIKGILSEISFVKNGRIPPEHYYPMKCAKEAFSSLYDGYGRYLKRSRKIDFDDMLVNTYELFQQRKDILAAWRNKYRYILIDEFQDVNQIQYDIVRMLAEPENNLFLVGDDDQSIYRFRGAKPEIMLHMPKDYPDAKIIHLVHNYRCPQDVVRMASRIIGHNSERFPKEMIAVKQEEHSITQDIFDSQREAYAKVAERIRAKKHSYRQTAVLYRTNIQARVLMERLMEYNIPFVTKDQTPNLYEHWIAKDMLAYVRLAMGSRRRSDFLMVMNRPKRYLSRESLEKETVTFDAWQAFYADRPWMEERIEKLQSDLLTIKTMRPFAALNYIRKAIGYDGFLEEYAELRNIEKEELFEILDALQEGSRSYPDYEQWFLHMKRYQQELKEAYSRERAGQDAVTLATFHSAKGLEFDAVHLIDVNEGVTPYKKAVLPSDMEEERRMFYVAVTRAKKELYLYISKIINRHNAEISRFLLEAED